MATEHVDIPASYVNLPEGTSQSSPFPPLLEGNDPIYIFQLDGSTTTTYRNLQQRNPHWPNQSCDCQKHWGVRIQIISPPLWKRNVLAMDLRWESGEGRVKVGKGWNNKTHIIWVVAMVAGCWRLRENIGSLKFCEPGLPDLCCFIRRTRFERLEVVHSNLGNFSSNLGKVVQLVTFFFWFFA